LIWKFALAVNFGAKSEKRRAKWEPELSGGVRTGRPSKLAHEEEEEGGFVDSTAIVHQH